MSDRGNKGDGVPYLHVSELYKDYGSVRVLDDVSLSINKGEFICFLGPSGCGKTTLLRAIAGLDVQTSGSIVQDGKEITNLPPAMRDFGIVFQSYALFPNLTVRENVGFGLKSTRLRRDEIARQCDELIAMVGISPHADKYPFQLSGGQQQRVAIARAIAMKPSLLLLDEPLSALDARVRIRLRSELKDLQRKLDVTTIMVTHDQDEALSIADRIVVMNEGRIEQFDTPQKIYREPKTRFTADFVGDMVVLDGVHDGSNKVRVGDLELTFRETQAFGKGDQVSLAIRPEDIVLRNAVSRAQNMFEATVQAIEFAGAVSKVRLTVPGLGARQIHAHLSNGLIEELSIDEAASVTVSLPREKLHAFARSGAGS